MIAVRNCFLRSLPPVPLQAATRSPPESFFRGTPRRRCLWAWQTNEGKDDTDRDTCLIGQPVADAVANLLGQGGRVGEIGWEQRRWLIRRDGLFSFEFVSGGESTLRSGSVVTTAFSCADPTVFAMWLATQTPATLALPTDSTWRMTRAALAWYAAVGYGIKTNEPLGRELAERVADFLEARPSPNGICQVRRDHCGMGLFFNRSRNVFEHNEVYDGFPHGPATESFSTRVAFVDWLTGQHDLSLRGPLPDKADMKRLVLWDNQRLTKVDIETAINRKGPGA
jgi:hypothetical protein